MKPKIIVRLIKSSLVKVMLGLLLSPAVAIAQTDTTKVPAGEEALISPSVVFLAIQKSDNSIDLKASYKAKVKGSLIKLRGIHIMFYAKSDSVEKDVGMVNTDNNGVATVHIKGSEVATDSEGKLHFKASFAGNKTIEATDEELTVKRARLDIIPVKGDSTFSVQLKLVDLGGATETPIPETNLGVFVKRMFNPLKLGEGKTDETGETIVEIPANLPGDPKGNLTLIAKLEDNETYGNLEASTVQQWGVPVSDEIKKMPRALWSTHPPLWMLITFIILVTVVWGHYIVILYELFRLRKEHPDPSIQEVNNQ